jgi:hypothetical protein
MKLIGKAEYVAAKIIEAFKSGNLPKALAPIFIHRKDGVPCRSWSWGNQLLCVLYGTSDARGFRQWNEVGRYVKKGSKAFDILVPLMWTLKATDPKTGERKKIEVLSGFRAAPVFAVECTEGQELPIVDDEVVQWLNALPLVDVAKSWGLEIDAIDPKKSQHSVALGRYYKGKAIALSVSNLSTWAHELIHAADDRLGNLNERGQHWRSETVAELGGAILLEALGFEVDSDRGGAWHYVKTYADNAGIEPIQACMQVLKRTCDAVNLLLTEAGKLALLSEPHAA